jgi:beta-lactamase class A
VHFSRDFNVIRLHVTEETLEGGREVRFSSRHCGPAAALRLLLISSLVVAACDHTGISRLSLSRAETPELRDQFDPEFQAVLEGVLRKRRDDGFWLDVEEKRMSVVVVDVTPLDQPQVAALNPDVMMYAASLPKLAIALGVIVKIDRGAMTLDIETRNELGRMIRNSSNSDATRLLHKVGIADLAAIVQEPRFGLYAPEFDGGLWVGKAYDKTPRVMGDPLHGLSHGATAMQVARFYYLAMTGQLADWDYWPVLQEALADPKVNHKFVKGLEGRKDVKIFRKSGTWRTTHADSGIIARPNQTYIAVVLANDIDGEHRLQQMIVAIDDMMIARGTAKDRVGAAPGGTPAPKSTASAQ